MIKEIRYKVNKKITKCTHSRKFRGSDEYEDLVDMKLLSTDPLAASGDLGFCRRCRNTVAWDENESEWFPVNCEVLFK